MRLSLTTETKTWFDQEATIRNIATQKENTLVKVQAKNVLHLIYRDTFPLNRLKHWQQARVR